MLVHTGDKVPADLRIVQLSTAVLRAEQSSLTGESLPVNKFTAATSKEHCELQVIYVAKNIKESFDASFYEPLPATYAAFVGDFSSKHGLPVLTYCSVTSYISYEHSQQLRCMGLALCGHSG